jgi:hypothetical protein
MGVIQEAGRMLIGLGRKRCGILRWRISWRHYARARAAMSRLVNAFD